MKQIIRRVIDRKGKVQIIDLPAPDFGPRQVLVQNAYSLISSGTELGTLSKTPAELVKQTLADPWMRHVVKQTIFATGLAQTGGRIWKEMIVPREIGYSGAGRVLAVGAEVEGFRAGDTAAYAATGHAEVVAPAIHHIVPVPLEVPLRHAAFVTVGGIAIQSLRRAAVEFGEVVAVYGLGLVGQLCAMIARAAGCVVIGIDLDDERNRTARELGADLVINPADTDVEREVMNFTGKHGADATILCASSKSDEIVNTAMKITRRQGRVVIVGYVGLNLHPKDFLQRELDLRYSRAYGPGSYHSAYEKGRVDYPFGYVRWTEKRNLEEFIRLLRSGKIEVERLIAEVFPIEDVQKAFDALRSGTLPGIAALVAYDAEKPPDLRRTLEVRPRQKRSGKIGVAIVGCGNHVLGKHLPHLQSMPQAELRALVSATGKNAVTVAKRYGATVITTDLEEALDDAETDAVMVCSNQPSHYEHIRKAIAAGKAVFVEKPMVTLAEDFHRLAELMAEEPVLFTLGLNRRYSSLVRKLLDTVRG
ncbi:MAG: bi-domain-containing oxidoreductase, partial [Thermoanaerobaculia bacterium]